MKFSRRKIGKNRLTSSDLTLETKTMLASASVSGSNAIQGNEESFSPEVETLGVETLANPDIASVGESEEVDAQDTTRARRERRTSDRENDRPRREREAGGATTTETESLVDEETIESTDGTVDASADETLTAGDAATAEEIPTLASDLVDDQPVAAEETARPTNNAAAIDTNTPEDVVVTRPGDENFTLAWSDEFNTADRRKWTATNRDTNDRPTNYPDSEGNPRSFRRLWRASNTSITEEGALNVQTKLTNRDPQNRNDPNQVLAGSRYITKDAFKPSDAEGGAVHIEARVRFPRAQGPHAAFWLLPPGGALDPLGPDLTGADGAEIDIFEANAQRRPVTANEVAAGQVREREDGTRFLSTNNFEIVRGNDGRDYVELPNTVRSGYHINGYNSVPSNVNARSRHRERLNTGQDNIYGEWQNVGITWSEDKMDIYWEGQLIDTIDPVAIPRVAEQILFSSQITSPGFGADLPDDLSELDDLGLEVDWVRVFHQNAEPSQETDPSQVERRVSGI